MNVKTIEHQQEASFLVTNTSPFCSRAARKISDQIDEELRRERIALQHMRGPKILLLGSGDSGKTTVLKQMKILHGDGFDEKERDAFRVRIYDNILDSMKALVYALETLGVTLAVPENEVS